MRGKGGEGLTDQPLNRALKVDGDGHAQFESWTGPAVGMDWACCGHRLLLSFLVRKPN